MLNHIVIMGRLTRDPELRRTQNGTSVASFSVACERDIKPQNGERETDFIDCIAWRTTGEFVSKYFTKGAMIIVSGRLQTREWTDRNGNKRKSTEIVADSCYFGESKRDRESQPGSYQQAGGYQQPQYQQPSYQQPSYQQTQYQQPLPASAPVGQGYQQSSMYPQTQIGATFSEIADDDGDLPF